MYLIIVTFGIISYAQGASLGEDCRKYPFCGAIDSACIGGTCQCLQGTIRDYDSCLQVIPGGNCVADINCNMTYGASFCLSNYCVCKEHHHYVQLPFFPNLRCVKNRGLYENCLDDSECYYGQDMLDKMKCIAGKCSCLPGYYEDKRRCSEGSIQRLSVSLFAAISGLILLSFYNVV